MGSNQTQGYGQAVHRYIIRLPLTKNRIDGRAYFSVGSTQLRTCHSSLNRSHICPRRNKCSVAEARGVPNAVITMYQIAKSSIPLTHLASAAQLSSCTRYKPHLLPFLPSYLHFYLSTFNLLKLLVYLRNWKEKGFQSVRRKSVSCHNLEMSKLMCHTHFFHFQTNSCMVQLK